MTQVLLEVDDGACPDGWEPERFGLGQAGETVACHHSSGKALPETLSRDSFFPELIIRKKYHSGIRLPSGWWVWRTGDNWIASKGVETWGDAVCGLQFLPGFIPPEDGNPRKIN